MWRKLLLLAAIVVTAAAAVAVAVVWRRTTTLDGKLAIAISLRRPAPAPASSPAQQPAESLAFRVAQRVMRDARYAALVTRDSTGSASVRTIDPLLPDGAMIVRFATNPRSRKVQELARDRRVALYYFDVRTSAYVTLYGEARSLPSAADRERHWKPEWTPFYPDRGAGVMLYEVRPYRLEVVSPGEKVEGDTLTWAPPTYILPSPGAR